MKATGDLGQRYEVRVHLPEGWTPIGWADALPAAEMLQEQAEANEGCAVVIVDRQLVLPGLPQ
jgi:hypothetical protein